MICVTRAREQATELLASVLDIVDTFSPDDPRTSSAAAQAVALPMYVCRAGETGAVDECCRSRRLHHVAPNLLVPGPLPSLIVQKVRVTPSSSQETGVRTPHPAQDFRPRISEHAVLVGTAARIFIDILTRTRHRGRPRLRHATPLSAPKAMSTVILPTDPGSLPRRVSSAGLAQGYPCFIALCRDRRSKDLHGGFDDMENGSRPTRFRQWRRRRAYCRVTLATSDD